MWPGPSDDLLSQPGKADERDRSGLTCGSPQVDRLDVVELERSLVVERVKSMRRARLEGRQIGRARLDVERERVVLDRRSGMSLTQVATKHFISRASVCRMMKEANEHTNPAVLTPSLGLAQQAGAGQ